MTADDSQGRIEDRIRGIFKKDPRDPDLINLLGLHYSRRLQRRAFHETGDWDAAQEIVQDAFKDMIVYIYKGQTYKIKDPITFLMVRVGGRAKDNRRREKRRNEIEYMLGSNATSEDKMGILDRLILTEQSDRARKIIEELPKGCQTIFLKSLELDGVHGSQKKIAKELGTTEQNVSKQLKVAKDRIRKALERTDGSVGG